MTNAIHNLISVIKVCLFPMVGSFALVCDWNLGMVSFNGGGCGCESHI